MKGVSGNPKGRPPVLLPEVQREIDRNKNAVKTLILSYLNLTVSQIEERQRSREIPSVEAWLQSVIERGINDGDMLKFKMLLEIVFGKLPEEKVAFDLTSEEKSIILTYRKRVEEEHGREALEDRTQDD